MKYNFINVLLVDNLKYNVTEILLHIGYHINYYTYLFPLHTVYCSI